MFEKHDLLLKFRTLIWIQLTFVRGSVMFNGRTVISLLILFIADLLEHPISEDECESTVKAKYLYQSCLNES